VQWTQICGAATVLLYGTKIIYMYVCVCHKCVLDVSCSVAYVGENRILSAQ
jgi:hypothetical protein